MKEIISNVIVLVIVIYWLIIPTEMRSFTETIIWFILGISSIIYWLTKTDFGRECAKKINKWAKEPEDEEDEY